MNDSTQAAGWIVVAWASDTAEAREAARVCAAACKDPLEAETAARQALSLPSDAHVKATARLCAQTLEDLRISAGAVADLTTLAGSLTTHARPALAAKPSA